MKAYNVPGYFPNGRSFEKDVLGKRIFFTQEQINRTPRLSYEASLAAAEADAVASLRKGEWNPQRPPTRLGGQLLEAVQQALRLSPFCRVELVRTLGTPLDVLWCVDCFFRLVEKSGEEEKKRVIVTVDLTTNPKKFLSGQFVTDFFLTPMDLYPEESLNAFAQGVANLLRKRYKRLQHAR